ncbi:ribonuclease P protein component 1 [Nitrososphaera sp.]|uniref:ribonuclease P protein component 1 n=1 Tax=Nitrososphaera sp. TaxID=1971748 RepID=UPI002ED7F8D3
MMTAGNILAHELIGLGTMVVESTDPTLAGIRGTIVFETKNTITIRTGGKTKQIAKAAAKKIEIAIPTGACFISGSSLIARPEDRVSRL